jgi:hypothetical protein
MPTSDELQVFCANHLNNIVVEGFRVYWEYPGYLSLKAVGTPIDDGLHMIVTPDFTNGRPNRVVGEIQFKDSIFTLTNVPVTWTGDVETDIAMWKQCVVLHQPALDQACRLVRAGINPCTHPTMTRFQWSKETEKLEVLNHLPNPLDTTTPIEDLIRTELGKDLRDEEGDYAASEDARLLENQILHRLKMEFNYNHEEDPVAQEAAQKATSAQIWCHYLAVTLPRLRGLTIEDMVRHELEKSRTIEEYGETEEHCAMEVAIIDRTKAEFGYDWEQDDDAVGYMLHATTEEIWMYHLEVILPKCRAQQKDPK